MLVLIGVGFSLGNYLGGNCRPFISRNAERVPVVTDCHHVGHSVAGAIATGCCRQHGRLRRGNLRGGSTAANAGNARGARSAGPVIVS